MKITPGYHFVGRGWLSCREMEGGSEGVKRKAGEEAGFLFM